MCFKIYLLKVEIFFASQAQAGNDITAIGGDITLKLQLINGSIKSETTHKPFVVHNSLK